MEENLYTPNCIRTFTGKYVNVFDPKPEMFCIEDIAHALSQMPRLGGHTKYFYSVAQHCLECHRIVSTWQFHHEKYTMLMHDCAEAYLTDLASPIKKGMPDYQAVEDNLNKVLAEVFGFTYPFNEVIKEVDKITLEDEWKLNMIGRVNRFEPMWNVENRFISTFYIEKRQRDERKNLDVHVRQDL